MSDGDPSYWIQVPPGSLSPVPAPSGPAGHSLNSEVFVLVLVGLFLLDTFLAWQRVCLNVSELGLHFSGCVSANAWSGTAEHVGQIAGVFAIVAVLLLGLRLGGLLVGGHEDSAARALVYGTVVAGSLKWLLVIGRLAAPGAWIGLFLLLAIAVLQSIGSYGSH